MRLKLKIKTNSPENKFIEKEKEKEGLVYVKAPAEENKANIELIKTLAKHYKVSTVQIKIIKGLKSKEKIVEITK